MGRGIDSEHNRERVHGDSRASAKEKRMTVANKTLFRGIQLFESDPGQVYTIETAAHVAQLPRRTILIYCKHGLVSPVGDPINGGYLFNDEGIRTLRRIEYLRTVGGVNLPGIKIILHLTSEVERLREETRFRCG